jgi:hypothetical protein
LENTDHDQVAAAMSLCQDGYAGCFNTGECALDGECFRSDKQRLHQAAKAIERAATDEPSDVAQEMIEAAKWLRARD